MTAADLHFGLSVRYQGQAAEIMDILWRAGYIPRVQIRVTGLPGRPVKWVALSELEAL